MNRICLSAFLGVIGLALAGCGTGMDSESPCQGGKCDEADDGFCAEALCGPGTVCDEENDRCVEGTECSLEIGFVCPPGEIDGCETGETVVHECVPACECDPAEDPGDGSLCCADGSWQPDVGAPPCAQAGGVGLVCPAEEPPPSGSCADLGGSCLPFFPASCEDFDLESVNGTCDGGAIEVCCSGEEICGDFICPAGRACCDAEAGTCADADGVCP